MAKLEGNRLADLDDAIDCLLTDLKAQAPVTGDKTTNALNAIVIGKAHAETAKALAILLERRSKLLGLDADHGLDWRIRLAQSVPLAHLAQRDTEAFLAKLWELDTELVTAGLPDIPGTWWRETLARFYRSGKRRLVVRKGRRVFASTAVAPRVAVAEALFGRHEHIPGTPPLEYGFFSIKREEANKRIEGVTAILDALGVAHNKVGQSVRLRDFPALFTVVTASHKTSVGGTLAFAWLDEVARWNDDDLGANPAELVVSSVAPALATLPDAKMFLVSSALTTEDFHARQFDLGDTDLQCTAFGETWVINPTLTEADTRLLEPDEKTWLREYAGVPSEGVENNWFGVAVDSALSDAEPPRIGMGQRPVISIDPAFALDHFGYSVVNSEPSDTVDPTTKRRYRRTWLTQAGAWAPGRDFAGPREALVKLRDEIALPTWRASGQDGTPRVFTDQAEYYSLSELARDVGLLLELVPWTGGSGESSKLSKFRRVRTAMREGAFLVSRGHSVVREFRSVRGVLTPSGNERIEYARTGDGHCDTLSAVVLGGAVALDRVPKAVEPPSVELDEGARLRAERIREVSERQRKQWERDPRVVMRAALRRVVS